MRRLMWAVLLASVVLAGCERPYRFAGSRLQQGLHQLSPDAEVVEFIYTWRHWWWWPPKEPLRANYVESWMAEDRRLWGEHFSMVIAPEPVAWLGAIDRGLYESGFRLDGGDPVRIWSYKAPAEVRKKGEELLAAAMDRIEAETKSKMPDLPVSRGGVRMIRLTRTMFLWVEPITPLTPKRRAELKAPRPTPAVRVPQPDDPYPVHRYQLVHVFPTLGRIVCVEAYLLREQDPETIRGIIAEALTPAIELDRRHFVWSTSRP